MITEERYNKQCKIARKLQALRDEIDNCDKDYALLLSESNTILPLIKIVDKKESRIHDLQGYVDSNVEDSARISLLANVLHKRNILLKELRRLRENQAWTIKDI